ncbi:GATS protein-like 3 [Modicella reniformis]|uniref:GATS protein-like 3 n=1 Tax=Modicella reniformis TaxID=1440133 RepID=A0A9P6J2R4_9FUNG|nr:GATS protein-like 3 [Modicella reniformis]
MIVDILPSRLQLASLEKKDIPRCTHQLMKLVLFPSKPRHFFSYTETDKEVSLILDESHIAGFPEGLLNVCGVFWRAVQIEPGECGLGMLVSPTCGTKKLRGQISTYEADFTLMPECDLKRALECLSSLFIITNNPLEDLGLQTGDLRTWENSYPMSPSGVNSLQDALLLEAGVRERQSSLDGNSPGSSKDSTELDPSAITALSLNDPENSPVAVTPKATRHPFNANYPHRLRITSMEESSMDMLAIKLLESIFFDIRQTDTTLSIIMDDTTMGLFPDHSLNTHAGDWRLIAIGDGPLGFDECGIVSDFSWPLSESGINLFYLSTFNSDYIMVSEHDFERAVARLHETAKISDESGVELSQKDNDQGDESDSESESESYSGSESESLSEVDPDEYDDDDVKDEDEVEIVFEEDTSIRA